MNNALRRQEPLRELERQSEAQRMLAPQSEANVCRHKCNLRQDATERTLRRRGCGTD